jgi:hypothetical protein
MRVLLALFFCVCLENVAFAQTFSAVPSPLLTVQLAWNQANECYIHFQRNSGDTLRLHWRRLELSMPQDWTVDLCDYGSCYVGVPPNGLMNPIYGPAQAYLKLVVSPGAVPGSGWAWFRVYEEGNPDNFVDVYYSVYTQGTAATSTPGAGDVRVFPNPANRFITVLNDHSRDVQARLFDPLGRLAWEGIVPETGNLTIDVQTMSSGLYSLQIGTQIKKIMINR